MYEDHKSVLDYLSATQQVSHHATLQTTLPKVLLLAAASEFESRLCEILREHVRGNVQDLKILALVDQKAIKRQYHTLFEWDKRNAGKFWALFGSEFKRQMSDVCRRRPRLERSIAAFLELGSLRNQLVHNNYATFSLDKTLAEVFDLYEDAEGFVSCLPVMLRPDFADDVLDKVLPEDGGAE